MQASAADPGVRFRSYGRVHFCDWVKAACRGGRLADAERELAAAVSELTERRPGYDPHWRVRKWMLERLREASLAGRKPVLKWLLKAGWPPGVDPLAHTQEILEAIITSERFGLAAWFIDKASARPSENTALGIFNTASEAGQIRVLAWLFEMQGQVGRLPSWAAEDALATACATGSPEAIEWARAQQPPAAARPRLEAQRLRLLEEGRPEAAGAVREALEWGLERRAWAASVHRARRREAPKA